MKTTILTSFVAIALLSARRSFAIVVRSQVNIPAVPGPSLSQQNVPLSNQARRHLDLAATSAMVQRDDEERDVSTGRHLNAQFDDLVQEREFYKRGLFRFSKEDFKKAHYPAWVRGRFEQIYDNIFTIPVPDFRPFGI